MLGVSTPPESTHPCPDAGGMGSRHELAATVGLARSPWAALGAGRVSATQSRTERGCACPCPPSLGFGPVPEAFFCSRSKQTQNNPFRLWVPAPQPARPLECRCGNGPGSPARLGAGARHQELHLQPRKETGAQAGSWKGIHGQPGRTSVR